MAAVDAGVVVIETLFDFEPVTVVFVKATTPDGNPVVTAVPIGDRTVLVQVWRVRVGRVKLYLLDTDLEENAPWDRELSARLYGGDRETRVQQEIILGIGGVRALKSLGIEPSAFHLNEGHAAFVGLEKAIQRRQGRNTMGFGATGDQQQQSHVKRDEILAHAGIFG